MFGRLGVRIALINIVFSVWGTTVKGCVCHMFYDGRPRVLFINLLSSGGALFVEEMESSTKLEVSYQSLKSTEGLLCCGQWLVRFTVYRAHCHTEWRIVPKVSIGRSGLLLIGQVKFLKDFVARILVGSSYADLACPGVSPADFGKVETRATKVLAGRWPPSDGQPSTIKKV